MNVQEVLELLWRRKVVLVAVAAATVGAAAVALQLVTPIYESTSTLVLRPAEENEDDFSFFYALEQIVPIYANAATTRETRELARGYLGGSLGSISVRTFRQSPIIKISARDSDPALASGSAQAVSEALLLQVDNGRVGLRSLELTQIDRPSPSSTPIFPRTKFTLAVATLLGLALGVAAAFLRDSMGSKVETAEGLATLTGLPVYAEIRHEPAVRRLRSADSLVGDAQFRRLHESLRDLRTNLHFSHGNLKSIVVTSPEGRHGKTTVSFGLAVTYARAGARTLLVDGDLRRGRISEFFAGSRGAGLMEVLRGAAVEMAIRPTGLPNLFLMTRGEQIFDPGELLQAKFSTLLRSLEEMYDVVVLDATPLAPVNDARVMASFAEATLLVASATAATRRQVRAAVARLSLISVTATAAVLNDAKTARGDYYEYAEPERPRRGISVLRP